MDARCEQLQAKTGDVGTLFRLHRYAVLQAVRSRGLFGEDAEDVCSEVFAKAITKASGGFNSIGAGWEGWLRVTARNLAVDVQRRNARQAKNGLGSSVVRDDGAGGVLDRIADDDAPCGLGEAEKAILQKAVSGLCIEQREVVVMHLWGNLRFREIAELLGISVNTVLGRYRYAMANLRKDAEVLNLR